MSKVKFDPITPSIGAYVRVDLDDVLDDGVPERILEALSEYNVLVFPEINMSDETYIALNAAMGDVQELYDVAKDEHLGSEQGVYRISLDKDDKTQIEFVKGNDWWHMDGIIYDTPGKSTMLKCESPPSEGGDTGFASLYAAWEALPEERKEQLKKLEVVHCMKAVASRLYDAPTEEDYARWDSIWPDTFRPLVWQQSGGRVSMLIGSTADRITGMSDDEGRAILDELYDWATQDRFTYRHKWKKGDLVMFNNPGLLHRSYPYDKDAGRVMHRLTLEGTEKIRAAA
ncbi:TauD/TfdA dioxygenase family protein [Pontixanthobacter aquaemixtae]|uniref:TauD/TfdA family dioxygenase n=1 Tax=Pontixanthobacter aquaemixtae TaxID=1958940 RepID=A0A844ZS70_9SPHN|nr:TauD/TfdA family dioxygenase [Pontixanthobacter aquaemixtae]MXO89960.1 TauD/TfdA family dioxygenase [Pontixanthobacter aquaemixtae]